MKRTTSLISRIRQIHFLNGILGLVVLVGSNTSWGQESDLTIDRILAQPSLTGTSPVNPVWSPDSNRLAFLWNDEGMPNREIWIVNGDGNNLRQLTSETEGTNGVSELVWTTDGGALLYIRAGDVWRVDEKSGKSGRLTTNPGAKSHLAVSPNGNYASFLQDGDLWLLKLGDRVLTQATRVGVPSISSLALGTYNRPDVEIGPYVWGGPTYRWSPDNRTIAVHYVDRRKMRTVPFPYFLADETMPNQLRRGYPGDPNEHRSIGFFDVETGKLNLLDLPEPTKNRIVDFSWSHDGKLLLDRESDTAVDRWLHQVDPANGRLEQLWHDKRESRVYTSIGSAWHPDGKRVVFLSDIGDRYGLYLLDPEQGVPKLLTNKQFDVTAPPIVTFPEKTIFFQSNETSPYERHAFRIPCNGGNATRISKMAGLNQAYPSSDGSKVAILHSDDLNPTELYLVVADGRSTERKITNSPPKEFAQRSWARARYVTFPSRTSGQTLHARVLEPADLDRSKRYPVVFGPVYSNTVRNRRSSIAASRPISRRRCATPSSPSEKSARSPTCRRTPSRARSPRSA